jgi:hypothetical protein
VPNIKQSYGRCGPDASWGQRWQKSKVRSGRDWRGLSGGRPLETVQTALICSGRVNHPSSTRGRLLSRKQMNESDFPLQVIPYLPTSQAR